MVHNKTADQKCINHLVPCRPTVVFKVSSLTKRKPEQRSENWCNVIYFPGFSEDILNNLLLPDQFLKKTFKKTVTVVEHD